VECLSNTDCTTGNKNICYINKCVACTNHSECSYENEGKSKCDVGIGQCCNIFINII
jgi:hypothetical protein